MVKIHFLQKVLKKWSSFRKQNKKKISIIGGGGGGSGPYMEFSIIDFIFFFEPFPYWESMHLTLPYIISEAQFSNLIFRCNFLKLGWRLTHENISLTLYGRQHLAIIYSWNAWSICGQVIGNNTVKLISYSNDNMRTPLARTKIVPAPFFLTPKISLNTVCCHMLFLKDCILI